MGSCPQDRPPPASSPGGRWCHTFNTSNLRLADPGQDHREIGPTPTIFTTLLGVARAAGAAPELARIILGLRRDLFVVAADLACNPRQRQRLRPRVSLVVAEMVGELERIVDSVVAEHPLRPVFVVPGATLVSATLDLARTVVRRAERQAVQVQLAHGTVNPQVITYLNRASDLIYVLARWAASGSEEPASRL